MKTNFLSFFIIALIITSCMNQEKEESENEELFEIEKDFNEGAFLQLEDITDKIQFGDSLYSFSSAKMVMSELPLNNMPPTERKDLEGMRTIYQIYKGESNAGINVPGFGGLKLGQNQSNLNLYFLETKKVIQNSDTLIYGIGYSVHYLFNKVKRGIDVSNLPSVAASAQLDNNKTSVLYGMRSYGISSREFAKFFKTQVDNNYDVNGFGFIQSNIDGIHNILMDSLLSSRAKFTPEVITFLNSQD